MIRMLFFDAELGHTLEGQFGVVHGVLMLYVDELSGTHVTQSWP